jgi:glutamyl-tRNA synthetase
VAGLEAARSAIAGQGGVAFEADELEPVLREVAAGHGWKAGDLFMAIRVAITGRTAAPPLFDSMVALGRDRTLRRLDAAIEVLRRTGA